MTIIRHTLITLAIAATALFVIACDKVDDNGNLGGMWQLTEWKVLPDGTIKATKADAIFYSVQLDLMKLSRNNDIDTYHLCRFSHKGDSLIIGKVYDRPKENIVPVTDLAKYGVPATGAFRIRELSSSRMVLESDEAILTFRKY